MTTAKQVDELCERAKVDGEVVWWSPLGFVIGPWPATSRRTAATEVILAAVSDAPGSTTREVSVSIGDADDITMMSSRLCSLRERGLVRSELTGHTSDGQLCQRWWLEEQKAAAQ